MGVTLGKCSTHPSLFGNGIIWEGPIMVIALSLSLSLSLSQRERERYLEGLTCRGFVVVEREMDESFCVNINWQYYSQQ
jgi:hypothetical protein